SCVRGGAVDATAVAGDPEAADAAVVAGADRPVATVDLSRLPGAMGVARDDLPGDLLPGPRRVAAGPRPAGRAAVGAGETAPAVAGRRGQPQPPAVGSRSAHLHPPG